jgi:hypothetical protein
LVHLAFYWPLQFSPVRRCPQRSRFCLINKDFCLTNQSFVWPIRVLFDRVLVSQSGFCLTNLDFV